MNKLKETTPPKDLTLGGRVRWARAQAGMTGVKLANLAGIDARSIGTLERRGTNTSIHLPIIAEILGCDLVWLSRGVGEPFPTGVAKNISPESKAIINKDLEELYERAVEAGITPEKYQEIIKNALELGLLQAIHQKSKEN